MTRFLRKGISHTHRESEILRKDAETSFAADDCRNKNKVLIFEIAQVIKLVKAAKISSKDSYLKTC